MAAMDASTNGHARPDDVVPAGWRWTLPRALGFAAFLALTLFWIWAFANRDTVAHPDEFDDPIFVDAAESLCAERQAAIAELPLATAASDPINRGRLLGQGTVELVQMVSELRALDPPTDPKGADGVSQWLRDYETYLDDRRVYAEVLATGDDPPFLISANPDGVRVTDLLGTFAEVNSMSSCAPSGDV